MLGKLKKKPNNFTELCGLLGLVEYFRRAIPNFSQIAKPLFDMLKNSRSKQPDLTSRSKQPINWTKEHQYKLDNLLIHVVSPPILAFSYLQLPFVLQNNASAKGSGYALYQIQKNQIRVLSYSSSTLVATESK